MITLKLTPGEFEMMLDFLRVIMQNQRHIALRDQPLSMVVLMEYMNRWYQHRVDAWKRKKWNREHTLNMADAIAKAMHEEMRLHQLTPVQQSVLNKLDQAIVSYRNTHTQSYQFSNLTVIGSVS